MIQATPLSPIQARTKLEKAFIDHIGDDVSQASLNSLVDFIGNTIRLGHVQYNNGEQIACAPATVLAAAKNAFEALSNVEGSQDLINSTKTNLDKAYAETHGARILQASLKSSEPLLNEIVTQLAKVNATGENSNPNLLQNLVAQAEISAGDDVKLFGEHLGALLKEESANLTEDDVKQAMDAIDTLKLEVSAYAAFETAPELKDVVRFLGEQEGVTTKEMEVTDKKVVVDLIKEAQKTIESAGPSQEGQRVNAKTKLTRELGKLSDKQKLYFKELTGKYTELKASEPSEWITKITESLPGLVVPGIIGVMIASIFGFSGGAGAMLAAAVSFLGGSMSPEKAKPPEKLQAA